MELSESGASPEEQESQNGKEKKQVPVSIGDKEKEKQQEQQEDQAKQAKPTDDKEDDEEKADDVEAESDAGGEKAKNEESNDDEHDEDEEEEEPVPALVSVCSYDDECKYYKKQQSEWEGNQLVSCAGSSFMHPWVYKQCVALARSDSSNEPKVSHPPCQPRARHIHRGTNIMCRACFNETPILHEGKHHLPSPPVVVHASFLSLGVSLTCVVIAWEKGDEFDDNEYPLVRILRNCTWKDCKVPENDENHHVLLQKCIGVDGKGCSTFQYVHPPCYVTGWNQEWSGVGPPDTEDGHLYCHTCSARIGTYVMRPPVPSLPPVLSDTALHYDIQLCCVQRRRGGTVLQLLLQN